MSASALTSVRSEKNAASAASPGAVVSPPTSSISGRKRWTFLDPAYASLKADRTPPPEIATAADGAAEGLFGLASSLGRQNASETALLFGREALYLRPNFPAAQILVAGLLEADDRLEAANTVYAAIDRTSPFSPAARIKVASNLDRMDRTDEAVAELEALARAYPERTDALAEIQPMRLFHISNLYLALLFVAVAIDPLLAR